MRNRCEEIKAIKATIITTMAIIVASFTFSSVAEAEPVREHSFTPQDMIVPLPTSSPATPTPTPNPAVEFCNELSRAIESVEITYTDIEYEYLGTFFITAYCPAECGWNGDPDNLKGWYTASGEICHRAAYEDRLFEPTTCAIDPNYASFGDLFYIEEFDRVFIAEDTGSAVKKYHLDLFYEDYEDVISFPTGYYTVYSVNYVTKTISGGK